MTKDKAIVQWINGFDLGFDRTIELIEWAMSASDLLTTEEIKKAIQEKIDYNC